MRCESPSPESQGGNYREVEARDTTEIYPRGVAHQQLFVSNFARSAFLGNRAPRNLALGKPIFLETDEDPKEDISASHGNAQMEDGWAVNRLNLRGIPDRRGHCKSFLMGHCDGVDCSLGESREIKTHQEDNRDGIYLIRRAAIEIPNYRFSPRHLEGNTDLFACLPRSGKKLRPSSL